MCAETTPNTLSSRRIPRIVRLASPHAHMRPQPPKWRYFSAKLGTAFSSIFVLFPLLVCLQILPSNAQITVYYVEGQRPLGSATATAASTNYTGSAAYNPTVLQAPPPPGAAAMPTNFAIELSTSVPQGASILQSGNFFGFSIEMSVVNQVCEWIAALECVQSI